MSEKEVTEERIDKALQEIIDSLEEELDVLHVIKLYAKIIFNLRYDLNELKLKLVEAFKNSGSIDSDDIYLKYPESDLKKGIVRDIDDIYS